jgi:hypothetical protein
MTQAFNLSQLANNVNTSGLLNAAAGLYNQTPVANGGTGVSSVASGNILVGAGTSAMTPLAGASAGEVVTWSGTAWTSAAGAGGALQTYTVATTPGTWTKPASIKGIKVTVVGGGGNGGAVGGPAGTGTPIQGAGGGGGGAAIRIYPAPSLPGPQPYTVGGASGTSSFGVAPVTVISATGGVSMPGSGSGGTGGIGSNGTANIGGSGGGVGLNALGAGSGIGGSSIFGGGGAGVIATTSPAPLAGNPGRAYGGGGSGGSKNAVASGGASGSSGAAGVVIIEEFY